MPKSPKKTASVRQQASDKRISTEWFHGLDPEEREALERAWRNSTYVLDRLKGILERQIESLDTDKRDDYNNPQWPVLRADLNGELRALKNLIRLLP